MKELLIASGNAGKLSEFMQCLTPLGWKPIGQASLGIDDAEESGLSFVENALIKARHAARLSGRPALADDSGLLVDALDGAPGLHTARYAGVGANAAQNIQKLLNALKDVPADKRQARFVAVIVVLSSPDDPCPLIAQGEWRGEILSSPRGAAGFGYDPIFFDPQHAMSAAEMPAEIKNQISHRGQALKLLADRLRAF